MGEIIHGSSIGAYQRCLHRPEGSCQRCKDFAAAYQRVLASCRGGYWSTLNRHKQKEERENKMSAVVRQVRYVFQCDACGNEIVATAKEPTSGVVGEVNFPDSAFGMRQNYAFFSCKEDASHVSKAYKTVLDARKANVDLRKRRGEEYSRNGQKGK